MHPVADKKIMPLQSRFMEILTLDPHASALEFEGRWYSWGYFQDVLSALRTALAESGLPENSRIGFAARNRPAHAATLVGLLVLGQSVITINPFMSESKLAADLDKIDVPVLIADEDDWKLPQVRDWAARKGVMGIALGFDMASPVRIIPELRRPSERAFAAADPDIAVEMLTSGTTGEPKRVPMKYSTLDTSLRDGIRSGDGEVLRLKKSAALLYAPLVHAGGLYGLLLSVYEARPVALMEKFTVDAWREAMRNHKPRFASLVPTLIRMILDANVPREDLASLIAVRSGTAPLDAETHKAFEERYGLPILINYGATEFAGAVTGWTLPEYQQLGKEKFGSVGRARGDISLRIIDPDTGNELGVNGIGVLEIQAARLGGEWIRTTDLARLDQDGFLFMHGRADDAIIRGGFKVLPEQVAQVLRRHEAVADAIVIGLPDSRLGQVPVAAIELHAGKLKPDSAALEAFARQHLVSYQVPVNFLIVDELPRTPSLKISRPMVKALFEGRA